MFDNSYIGYLFFSDVPGIRRVLFASVTVVSLLLPPIAVHYRDEKRYHEVVRFESSTPKIFQTLRQSHHTALLTTFPQKDGRASIYTADSRMYTRHTALPEDVL